MLHLGPPWGHEHEHEHEQKNAASVGQKRERALIKTRKGKRG